MRELFNRFMEQVLLRSITILLVWVAAHEFYVRVIWPHLYG